jgi:hypothetical protein
VRRRLKGEEEEEKRGESEGKTPHCSAVQYSVKCRSVAKCSMVENTVVQRSTVQCNTTQCSSVR